MLGCVLLPAIQTATEQGFITTGDDCPCCPVIVAELLLLYVSYRIKLSLFDHIFAACIANTGMRDVSLVPVLSIKRIFVDDA
ncbi:hypothetical protein F4823DRAFT_586411, partial [Ustulina deusta]